MAKIFEKSIEILDNVKVRIENDVVIIEGPNGKNERFFNYPRLKLNVEENKVFFRCDEFRKKDKMMFGTIRSHIRNMMTGVVEPYVYILKVCSSHFPMNVDFKNHVFSVKNFLGEKTPRTIKLDDDVDVKIDGEMIEIKSINKEKAGTNAAKIENLMRAPNLDRRIFQDGIYIVNKGGKELL